MRLNGFFVISFSAFLLLQLGLAAAVSSEVAKTTASNFVEKNSNDKSALVPYSLNGPVLDDDEKYWIAYLAPESAADAISPSFLKIAVYDSDGKAVESEALLSGLFLNDYKYYLENVFLKSKRLSYPDLQVSLEALRENVKNAKKNFGTLKDSVSKRDHSSVLDEKLSIIESMLDDLSDKVQNLADSSVSSGLSLESDFRRTGSIESYSSAIENYNHTFEALVDFVDSYEAYRTAATDTETYALLVIDEQQLLYKISNLEPATVASFQLSKNLLQSDVDEYNYRLFQESVSAVNDSVQSTLHRIAKINAVNSFENSRASVESTISASKSASRKALYAECGMDDDALELEALWRGISDVVLSPSSTAPVFKQVPANVTLASSKAKAIDGEINNCLNKPRATPKPSDTSGYTDLLIVVAIILIAGVAYFKYKKSQQVDLE